MSFPQGDSTRESGDGANKQQGWSFENWLVTNELEDCRTILEERGFTKQAVLKVITQQQLAEWLPEKHQLGIRSLLWHAVTMLKQPTLPGPISGSGSSNNNNNSNNNNSGQAAGSATTKNNINNNNNNTTDFQGKFRQLLAAVKGFHPQESVIAVALQRLSSRVLLCNTTDEALGVYDSAKYIPLTSTRACILESGRLLVNGVLHPDLPSNILLAWEHDCCPRILKVDIDLHEKEVVDTLGVVRSDLLPLDVPLVPVFIQEYTKKPGPHTPEPERKHALKMRVYSCLAAIPQIEQEIIYKRVKPLVKAVNYIHFRGFVHMDIKSANVFVDVDGVWLLGDYGGCVEYGNMIRQFTIWFQLENLEGKMAKYKYDWLGLLVLVLVECEKANFLPKQLTNEVIETRIRSITHEPLQILCFKLKEAFEREDELQELNLEEL